MNFVLSHESIEKFSLIPKLQEENELTAKNMKLLGKMPKLIDLEICIDNLTSGEIVSFFMESRFLNKVQLWYQPSKVDYKFIQSQLKDQWNFTSCKTITIFTYSRTKMRGRKRSKWIIKTSMNDIISVCFHRFLQSLICGPILKDATNKIRDGFVWIYNFFHEHFHQNVLKFSFFVRLHSCFMLKWHKKWVVFSY